MMVRALSKTFASALLVATQLVSMSFACSLPTRAANDSAEYPYPDYGSDDPADLATVGYNLNHLCLNVKNLTASVDFYSGVFGLRKLFTLHVSEHFSITYMGHSHGGKNGTGYQTNKELNREKNNAAGLLELIHLDVPDHDLPASTKIANAFAHVGMVVPDIEATQARLEAFGVPVLKKFGEPMSFALTEIATAFGLTPEAVAKLGPVEKQQVEGVLGPLNAPLVFAKDPDGNVVEIQAQEAVIGQ